MASEPEEDRFDGPCVVCGENVLGRVYVALGLFAVITAEGDGVGFEPDEEPCTVADWRDIPLLRVVHAECLPNYVEGVVADADFRRARGEMEETDP